MRKTLRYMLYTTVCIVSLIIVLICLWWFTARPYTKEEFIVPAPHLVMAAVDTQGNVFYADIDVPINPRWVAVGAIRGMGNRGIGSIVGSYGQLYCVPSGTYGDTIAFGTYDAMQGAQKTTQVLKQISVDDDGTLVGIDPQDKIVYGSNTNTFTTLTSTAKSVAVSGGQLFAIGTDSILRYYPSSRSAANAVVVSPGGKADWKQVAFDGSVCALQADGTLWCADNNISDATRWVQQGSQKFNTISIRGGRLVGIGTNGTLYYSNTCTSPSWKVLPSKEYNKDTGAIVTNRQYWINNSFQTVAEPIFTTIILFYPGLDARRKRFAVAGRQCGDDEEKIGNFCYAPCASGRTAVGVKCPFRRKHTAPIPVCPSGEYVNGSCYQPCPDSSMTARGELCIGQIVVKQLVGKETNTIPESYACGDGTIGARYVRIRPTNLASVTNNKLCISRVVVKDKDGNVLSLLSGVPSIKSTIGSISGTNIRGRASIPILSTQTVNIPGQGSSMTSLTLYIAEQEGYTIMIASDPVGTAKYYSGAATAWTSTYWTNGTSGGNRASAQYILKLHANPVTATATDGTCVDTPIGGGSCSTAWSTYVSSTKYDSEADGGRMSRETKTYWELDLGDIQQIRTIEFTGCNYIPVTGATATAIDSGAVSQPTADQITGMRIELLQSENLTTTKPIVERSLGPELQQNITFNYLTVEPGVEGRCYDACPKINGVQSVDGGQQTCVAASGGMSLRSITTPLKLPPPVCSLPTTDNGRPYVMPAKDGTQIGNWVMNPTMPSQVLSCDHLPGSKLMPLVNSVVIPVIGTSSPTRIEYVLQRPNNVPYVAADPNAPYKCAILNDSVCSAYNSNGKTYVYSSGLCVRIDVMPNFQMNQNIDKPLGESCPDGYVRPSGNVGICTLNNGESPSWGRVWTVQSNARLNPPTTYAYGFRAAKTLYDLVHGNPVVSTPPDSDVSSPDNFKIPLITDSATVITDPKIFPAQCKCLNPDGSVNTQATVYNNTCVKCPNPNALFYYKGAISNKFAWGDEQKNKYLSIYDDQVRRAIDQKPYTSLNDAKTLCETDPFCTGVTRSYNAQGTPYYYMRAGTLLKGTRPRAGGGSSTSSATAGSLTTSELATWDSSWLKGAQGSDTIIVGLRKGLKYATKDIPTAFADDYISPVPRSSSVFSIIPSTVTNLINSMTNEMLQAASAWSSFQTSVQNPNTYYELVGVERQLKVQSTPADNGICVAPCGPKHSLHDPIQMVEAELSNTNRDKIYVLYGTTCHDPTQSVINKPSIPAIYTPQVGSDCRDGYNLTTGGSCLQQCSSNSKDTGSSCFGNSIRRPSIAPNLSCPSGLTLVGGACVHPCGSGYTDDGDYCKPRINTVTIPSSINCVKTAYTYSTKYQRSGASTAVDKWLCDSDYDQYTLLQGPPGVAGSAYVNPNDIVCYADDASTGMYYCQTVTEARNELSDTARTDFSTSCDSMTKAYLDLSNNLTTLMSAQSTAQTASAQTAAIQVTLQTVIDKLCGASGNGTSMCNTLRTQLAALSSNINSGSGAISGVLSPIAVARSSRDNLVTLLRTMKCCPEGQTQYPWC